MNIEDTEQIETNVRLHAGHFRMVCWDPGNGSNPHFALIHGTNIAKHALVRVQSECITGHVFRSLSCDCYEQLNDCVDEVIKASSGVVIYLRQEGRGIGLAGKMKSYILQKAGADTVDANVALGFKVDEREYSFAAEILKRIGANDIRLLTNNPEKVRGLENKGIRVYERVPVPPRVREENRKYLETKASRMGHLLDLAP